MTKNHDNQSEFDFIQTFTGKRMYFMEPTKDSISITDIAQALSNLCRYSGHVNNFYSVAEHSVLLAEKIYNESNDADHALSALMHDATEAYLVDVPRPIKPHLKGYFEIERNLQRVIFDVFVISDLTDYIIYLDTNIVRNEVEDLFDNVPDWVYHYDRLEDIIIRNWTPEQARDRFILMFNFLMNDRLDEQKDEQKDEQ